MKPSRENILKFLQEEGRKPMKVRELARHMKVPQPEYRGFRRLVKDLEREGALIKLRNGRLAGTQNRNLVLGRLSVTSGGFGFLSPDEPGPDVFLRQTALGSALDGDRVLVRVTLRGGTQTQPEGEVVRVVERAVRVLSGQLRTRGSTAFVEPDDPRFPPTVSISSDRLNQASDGDIVAVRLDDWEPGQPRPMGHIAHVLGRPGDPEVDVLSIVLARQLPLQFPPHVLEQTATIPAQVDPAEIAARVDLRHLNSFTIDPADARDHDDALSVERIDDDRVVVGIHIADVSHYVAEGTPLDHEALSRGTSVYLVDRVSPMLPEPLSSGICSLVPDSDRLTVSVLATFTSSGALVDTRIEQTTIRSRGRLSYEQAQTAIAGDPDPEAATFSEDIRLLERIRSELTRQRIERGSIDLDLPEAEVTLDSHGVPVRIAPRRRLNSHRLIEEFMLLANDTVAQTLAAREVPILYRVHEPPDQQKLDDFAALASVFGHRFPKKVDALAIQTFLKSIEGSKQAPSLNERLLRSMKKAVYQPQNRGHFGLASPCYTHFTSPIRRYPDLLTHRILRETWEGLSGDRAAQLQERLPGIGDLATEREINAQEAERESVKVKQAHYYENRIGDVFEGTITGVRPLGFFVQLDETLVDGLVHVRTLEDDYYLHDPHRAALVGERTKRTFSLGDRVEVTVVRADRRQRQIDFLVNDVTQRTHRGRKPRGPRRR
tara:strand:- start:6269 stop:8419 length:2151 start_codon:yes stop_codon:yes gene_type:complete